MSIREEITNALGDVFAGAEAAEHLGDGRWAVTRWVLVAELLDVTSEAGCVTYHTSDMPAWTARGLMSEGRRMSYDAEDDD